MYATVPTVFPGSVRRASAVSVGSCDAPAAGDGSRLGEAEVEDLRAMSGQEDVCRLEIAVNDASSVRGVQRVCEGDPHLDQVGQRQCASGQALLQGLALEQLHCDTRRIGPDIVDGADVGMVQRGGGTRFALEAVQRLLVGGFL
jgi:hypothetical protein